MRLPSHVDYWLEKWGWIPAEREALAVELYHQRVVCDNGGHVICEICGDPHEARGMCKKHYNKWYRQKVRKLKSH